MIDEGLTAVDAHVQRLAREVLEDLEGLTDRLVGMILASDPSYGEGRTSHADLRRSCRDNVARTLEMLSGDTTAGSDMYDAPHATGRRRAEQGMPLEAVLHSYRIGQRSIWDSLVLRARGDGLLDSLVEAASAVWEIVDAFASEVGRAYRETERAIARRDDRRRDALLDALLEGRGRERAVAADAATGLDLPEHGRYVVLVLAGTDSSRSAADALSVRGVRAAWRSRADREIGLVALARSEITDLLTPLNAIPGLRGGLSPVVEGLSEVDAGYRLAETAFRALSSDGVGVGELDARLPAALLVSAPDLAARLVERALGSLLALEGAERDVLLQTLATWLDTGGSAGVTAARLYCHRNTVLNRLRRLEAVTGKSVDRVDHLAEWWLALLAIDVLPAEVHR